MFDLSDRAQIEITGRDRASFLHNFCTNDIKRLRPGDGCEAFLTNIKGRIVGHILVFAGESSLWLDSVPGSEGAIIAHLDRYLISEDAQLHARTAEYGALYVAGPQATARLKAALGIDADGLALYAHRACDNDGRPVSVRRVPFTIPAGCLLSARRDALPALSTALSNQGVHTGSAETFDALRIEVGWPVYGVDITEDNLAQEAGRTRQAISFTKGCYLGQEPIARLDALGHVNRELHGLRLATGPIPARAAPVLAGNPPQAIGAVTSAALSPADGKPVALALLRNQHTQPGTPVVVQNRDQVVPATVFWQV
jgi:folate-binding protein YgfZ